MDIRAERLARGLLQRELADAIGCCTLTVKRWEKGKLPLPVYQKMLKLYFEKNPPAVDREYT